GNFVEVVWRACGSGGVSRKGGRSGEVHSVDGAKDVAAYRREPAGRVLRCVLRPRGVYCRAVEARPASGAGGGFGAANACGAAIAYGRGTAGDPAARGKLRSSGESEKRRYRRVGGIGGGGDTASMGRSTV